MGSGGRRRAARLVADQGMADPRSRPPLQAAEDRALDLRSDEREKAPAPPPQPVADRHPLHPGAHLLLWNPALGPLLDLGDADAGPRVHRPRPGGPADAPLRMGPL